MCVSPVHKQTRNEENWSFASCFARYNVLGTVRSNIQFYNLSLYYVTKGSDTSHIFFFLKSGVFVECGHLVSVFFSTCVRYNKWLVLAVDTKHAFLLEEINIGLNILLI